MDEITVLPRFSRNVQLHLVANYLGVSSWSIILGIFGRTGDGKSSQLAKSLEVCKVTEVRINADELESGTAGDPARIITQRYTAASQAIASGIPTAIVIDDIDTTAGEWVNNTGTVNHQQLVAALMHIGDRPVDRTRSWGRRVPVFVTGNSSGKLYAPLRRYGRMTLMVWRPDAAETCQVVAKMFPQISNAAVSRLVGEFPSEPLSFFSEVRSVAVGEQLLRALPALGSDMTDLLRNKDTSRWVRQAGGLDVGEDSILETARRVSKHRGDADIDFLADRGRRAE
jgi:hypothetical protein